MRPVRTGRRGQGPVDRAACLRDIAAGELEEGEARLRVVPVFVRTLERLGRPVEVAHPQPHLADEVVPIADADQHPEPLELVAGLTRILLGLRPATVEHLQLGPMDPADARIAADRLASHPALALVSPLTGTLEITDVATAGHRPAEDVARDPQVQLAGGGSGGRLVDQGEAILPAPGGEQGCPLEGHRHEEGVDGALPAGHVHRPIRELDRIREPRRDQGAECLVDQQPGMDGRLGFGLEEALCPGQPAGSDRGGQALERPIDELQGDPRRIEVPAGLDLLGIGALEGLGRLVGLSGPPGRLAHELEVPGRQASVAVGSREPIHRLPPGVASECVLCRCERVDHDRTQRPLGRAPAGRASIISHARNRSSRSDRSVSPEVERTKHRHDRRYVFAEPPVDRDERGLESNGQRDVLGVIGLGPAKPSREGRRLLDEVARWVGVDRRSEESPQGRAGLVIVELTPPPQLTDSRRDLRPDQRGSDEGSCRTEDREPVLDERRL